MSDRLQKIAEFPISPARWLALEVLGQIGQKDAYSEISLNAALKKHHLKETDKNLATELVYGTLKWQLRLDWIIDALLKSRRQIPSDIRNALRIAFYQIIYLERVPEFAAVNESVHYARVKMGPKWAGLVNAILRNYLRHPDQIQWPNREIEQILAIAVETSHPEWLVQRWIAQMGIQETLKLGLANNRIPEVFFHLNPIKIGMAEFEQHLSAAGVAYTKLTYLPGFFVSRSLPALESFTLYQQGYLSIQDASAGLAVALLQPEKAMTIIDLCAAPGGKSTRMAELMQNTGQIFSVDRNINRLKLVKKHCRRLGIVNTRFIAADARTVQISPADAVLVDAPCSGLGVLVKKPDLKWRRQPQDIAALTTMQQQILNHAASLVKAGGRLVYSTCTLEPDENEKIIEKFLSQHEHFVIENAHQFVSEYLVDDNGYVKTIPHRHGMDGSFAVRLTRME